MVDDDKNFESDKQRAEVFDALGHPTRIAILKVLSEGSLGFADLKKKTGIQSSGHLQHHINKLCDLVKTDEYGKYYLSDQGKDALLTVGAVEDAAYPAKKRRRRLSTKKVAALLLVAIIASATVSVWAFDRVETHKRWVKQFYESFDYGSHMAAVGPLMTAYYKTPQESQRVALDLEIEAAQLSLSELRRTDQDRNSAAAFDKIQSFMSYLSATASQNLTQLSLTEINDLANAATQVGESVVSAYGAILNCTSMDDSGPPFWYFGPSPPDQVFLQEAADLAVGGQQIAS
jgi:DNA-binding transcriptional ArsR family regulator